MAESGIEKDPGERALGLIRLGRYFDVLVALIAIVGAVGSLFVLPYRVAQLEAKTNAIELQRQQDHDVLIEIRQDVKHLLDAKDGKFRSPRTSEN